MEGSLPLLVLGVLVVSLLYSMVGLIDIKIVGFFQSSFEFCSKIYIRLFFG